MKFLNDLTIEQIIVRLIAYVMIAFVLGRLVLLAQRVAGGGRDGADSPVSIAGLLMAVLFRQGWVRLPDPAYRKNADIAAFIAAFMAPVLLIWAADFLRPVLGGGFGPWRSFMLLSLVEIQVLLAGIWIINLLPLPFFAGGYLLAVFLPGTARKAARYAGLTGTVLVITFTAGWLPALGGSVLPYLSGLGGW